MFFKKEVKDYTRLSDGRVVGVSEKGIKEYRKGRWVKPKRPVSFDMLWFGEHLKTMEEVEKAAALPYDSHVHFHGKPCCLFQRPKGSLTISRMYKEMETITDYGNRYHKHLHPGDGGDRALVRCPNCGALFVRVFWEIHSFSDAPDSYYDEWYQVDSEEQAERLLELLPEGKMAGFDGPSLSSCQGCDPEIVTICADTYGQDPREKNCVPDEMDNLLLLKNCMQAKSLDRLIPRIDETMKDAVLQHLGRLLEQTGDENVYGYTATLTEVPDYDDPGFELGKQCVVLAVGKPENYAVTIVIGQTDKGKIEYTASARDSGYSFYLDPRPKYDVGFYEKAVTE